MAPPPAGRSDSIEELYLTGLHLEQYKHPTLEPEPYWEEALRRDPGDVRNNNALGRLLLRRGNFARAEEHFRRAIETLTRWNPNPYDGEPYYNLGLALKYQGRLDEAYAAFYKAIWSYAWQAAGYYALAQIDVRRGELGDRAGTPRPLAARPTPTTRRREPQGGRSCATWGGPPRRWRWRDATLGARSARLLGAQRVVWRWPLRAMPPKPSGAVLNELMRDDPQTYLDIAFDYAEPGCGMKPTRSLDAPQRPLPAPRSIR